MEWKELAEGVGLSAGVIAQLGKLNISEDTYCHMKKIYNKSHTLFFEEVKKRTEAPLLFLLLYCRMAGETYERYQEQGVEEDIFWDTFRDISFWCDNYKREYGAYGIGEYDWFWRHIDMTLFRLGRLQFERMKLEYNIGAENNQLMAGTPVINIHIPQGEKLNIKDCEESIRRAFQRYGRDIPYVCHSWLLYPGLKDLLPERSNILQFQKKFHVIETDYKEREAEWRIYGSVRNIVTDYPEDTSLQRNVKYYLLKGNTLGNGWGLLTKGEIIG